MSEEFKKEIYDLNKQIADLENQTEPLKIKRRELYKVIEKEVGEKVKQCHYLKDKFADEELVYSAGARCVCGAGLAYPEGMGIHGDWNCSNILTGRAEPGTTHDGRHPFAFYEIKSEGQPSANGQTTRR